LEPPEGKKVLDLEWGKALERLRRYGTDIARLAIATARDRNWTVAQVNEFLADAEGRSILGTITDKEGQTVPAMIRYWPPELVGAHLRFYPPGSRPDPKRTTIPQAWIRAKRDRDLRVQASAQAARDTADAEHATASRDKAEELERDFGPRLDAMTTAEVDDLVRSYWPPGSTPFIRYLRKRESARTDREFRFSLLSALRASSQVPKPET